MLFRYLILMLFFLSANWTIAAGVDADKKFLHVLSWSEYLDAEVVAAFEQEYNAKVKLTAFDSELQREIRLSHGREEFDLVLLSAQYIEIYNQIHWLDKIDPEKITNYRHIDPKWHNEYGIGYMWGLTGIAYREDLVPKTPESWDIILHPPESLYGKVALLVGAQEILSVAALANQVSLDRFTAKEATALFDTIGDLPNTKLYATDLDETNALVTGQLWLVQGYNGDTAFLNKEYNDKIKFTVPKEGGFLWSDYWSLLSTSNKKRLAYQFMDFLHRPEVAAKNATYLAYAPTNKSAIALMDKSLTEDTTIFPSDEILQRCFPYPSADAKRDRIAHKFYYDFEKNNKHSLTNE